MFGTHIDMMRLFAVLKKPHVGAEDTYVEIQEHVAMVPFAMFSHWLC